ncbi:hypothetical protein EVG20_g9876 [Dentipellis fragilis]|uniref:Uncharacterized protein n=1 Tax=Dentipellis fragilis TaxID=205917 RepID=A0A4Y9XXZ6_9AGAM|nr:hypothetical protein EVG20_g9876 [Dentipellis fragilis]
MLSRLRSLRREARAPPRPPGDYALRGPHGCTFSSTPEGEKKAQTRSPRKEPARNKTRQARILAFSVTRNVARYADTPTFERYGRLARQAFALQRRKDSQSPVTTAARPLVGLRFGAAGARATPRHAPTAPRRAAPPSTQFSRTHLCTRIEAQELGGYYGSINLHCPIHTLSIPAACGMRNSDNNHDHDNDNVHHRSRHHSGTFCSLNSTHGKPESAELGAAAECRKTVPTQIIV